MISLAVGLGNIGEEYVGTRHNVGFEALDLVASQLKARRLPDTGFTRRAKVEKSRQVEPQRNLTLAWPTTLMNRSGMAVAELLVDLGLEPAEMLIIVDDFNLPLGSLRFRPGGADGGHNGLVSITEHIGTEQFPRLRMGIGPLADIDSHSEFVLSRFASEELPAVKKMLAKAAEAVIFAFCHRFEEAMSKYNRSPASPDES